VLHKCSKVVYTSVGFGTMDGNFPQEFIGIPRNPQELIGIYRNP
jgi:hypothetical protein